MINHRLSKRLALLAGIAKNYSVIWDLCCDHAQLACFLKKENKDLQVYALDIQNDIIEKAKQNIGTDIHLIHADASQFIFPQSCSETLFIIAGVGSHLAIEIMKNVLSQFSEKKIHFLLCPHQDSFYLRYFLRQNKIGLVEEFWIEDRGVGYDIFLACNSLNNVQNISLVNSKMDIKFKNIVKNHLSLKKKFNTLSHIEKATYDEIFI